jgi:exodeoxyribonuclease VII small subunit
MSAEEQAVTATGGETFESVYRELEETVRLLDAGGQTLDESIALYERGMQLARRCQELLDAAELRIVTLQQLFSANGAGAQED